jgi:hypothetical protein
LVDLLVKNTFMQTIINDFEVFMGKHGTHYHQFYVGIACDLKDRLRNGHRVDDSTPCIYSTGPLHTSSVRAIEKFFLDKGAKGGPGGGDYETCYVYAYRIGPNTKQ